MGVEGTLLFVLLAVIVYSLASKAISRSVVTLPMIFVVIGYVCSSTVEAFAPVEDLHGPARILAEITLVLILFSDASHVRYAQLRSSFAVPLRMLAIGMPLTIAFGTAVVFVLSPEGGVAMCLLTAAILTPTDAALGQPVVTSSDVPQELGQAINVESGLNDGLALPFVLLGGTLVATTGGEVIPADMATMALLQVVLGPLAGAVVGWVAARALDHARSRNLVLESAQGVLFLAAAFVSYLAAEVSGGNGFIAAFIGGAVFGNTYRHSLHFISEFMEGAGELLTIAAFLAFGALILPAGLAHITVTTALIALAFLTVVRMGPIWVSLSGAGVTGRDKLFLGWFGPRGLASVLFTLIIIDEFDFAGEDELLACVSLTVALSVLLHGLTAAPLAKRMGRSSRP